jgi:hypothetical protein
MQRTRVQLRAGHRSRAARPAAASAAAIAAALPLALLAACGVAAVPTASQHAHASPVAQASPAAQSPGQDPAQAGREQPGQASTRPARSGTLAQTARPARAGQAGTTVPGAPGCPMFPADNVWNTDISKLPVHPRSAAWLKSMNSAGTFLHPDFGPNQGGYPFGMPFNVVTNAHPLVRITFKYAADSNKGPYPFGPDTRIEGGKKAAGDRHAIMVNSATCRLYELFDAHYSARRSRAGSGAIWNLNSNRLRARGHTSADAAGLPILPGLLNYRQVRAAVRTHTPITHAIRFTADRTRTHFIWPARHQAGSSGSRRLPPMGARFRLKASFDVPAFCHRATARYCQDAKAVLREMQHYGLILADNGSNWFFQGSAFPRWPDGLVSLLKRIPARAFEAVDESCLRAGRNSGKATAKPGCPIG